MARADDPGDARQRRCGGDDALADERVAVHERPLRLVERAGLVEDDLGDRDLADVVQLGRQAHLGDLGVGQPEAPRDGVGELRDAA